MVQHAARHGKVHMRRGPGDIVISVITYIVYAVFAFVCVYPFYYIFINSISANNLSERGKVILYPWGEFDLAMYELGEINEMELARRFG